MVRGRSARQLAGNPPSHPARRQHIAGQLGNDRDDAQAQKRRQIAQAQRPGDHGYQVQPVQKQRQV